MLLFCAKTICPSEEEKEEQHFGRLANLWFSTSQCFFHTTRHVVCHEALKNKW